MVKRGVVRELFLFCLLVFLLKFGIFALGPRSPVKVSDTADCWIPMHLISKGDTWRYGLCYWFPHAASGCDRFAMGFSYLRVTDALFLCLPGWFAYQIVMFLHYFLVGFFSFRLARDRFVLSFNGALACGITAILCTAGGLYSDMVDIGYNLGYCAVPLLIWLIDGTGEEKGRIGRILIRFVLSGILFGMLSSAPTSFPYVVVFLVLWFLVVQGKWRWSFWLFFCAFLVSAALVHLPNLLAGAAYAPIAQRHHGVGWRFPCIEDWLPLGIQKIRAVSEQVFFLLKRYGWIVAGSVVCFFWVRPRGRIFYRLWLLYFILLAIVWSWDLMRLAIVPVFPLLQQINITRLEFTMIPVYALLAGVCLCGFEDRLFPEGRRYLTVFLLGVCGLLAFKANVPVVFGRERGESFVSLYEQPVLERLAGKARQGKARQGKARTASSCSFGA
jgi:hypothetical protein